MGFWDRAGVVAGGALLSLQIGAFVGARFSPGRYFCWAPFHSASRYRIDASVGAERLTDAEIAGRYALAGLYWDPAAHTNWELNAISHVFDRIRATEAALPETSRASVTVIYRENGRSAERWSYP